MLRRLNGRPNWLLLVAVVVALGIALPAAAQSTGMVKGTVKDDKGQPVDGAKITIEMEGGTGRKFETKSDKKGEFIQLGLPSGSYKLTAEKDKLASPPSTVRVSVSNPGQANLVIGAAGAAMTKEAQAKNAELKKLFDEGVAAAGGGRHDEAVEKFTQAAALNATCYDCYYNIGFSYSQKKDYDKAEAAYKKAIELKPDYGEAYNGLSNIYNAQRKFDLAADAAAKANQLGGGGGG